MTEIVKRAFYDPTERSFTFQQVQDCQNILDHNAELRSMTQKSDWGRHIATIPNVVMFKWLQEEYDRGRVGLRMYTSEWDELVARKLEDPDYKHFRTDR